MNAVFERSLLVVITSVVVSLGCDGTPGAPPGPTAPAKVTVLPAASPEAAPERFKVPIGDSPAQGGAEARITLVVFSEFQCPFCARVVPTLAKLRERYGDDLRVVWKHHPLPFHERAVPAALAAEAAREQGRFWPMHDQLFAQQAALGPADLERHARGVGLDAARFAARLADPALKARVDADVKLGDNLGVRGTPTFFINGRKLVGAQPLETFIRVIEEEGRRADEKLRAGVARANLYAALIEGGLEKAPPSEAKPAAAGVACPFGSKGCPGAGAGAARPADDPASDATVVNVEVGAAPVRGPKDAPVTLVLFSDFECPFCKRIETTLTALETAFPGKIRVAWKNFPLGFHASARPAARLALQAHQSGKFWAMHDKLLANQTALDGPRLEGYARELGVAAPREDAGLEARLDADVAQGTALGVTGTPTVFVNGRRVAGAFPLETFRAIVEQELAKSKNVR
jgi:protein-disulfide isomerase